MSKIFNKIVEGAKTFSLTKEEKDIILDKVSTFIKENPIPVKLPIPTPYAEFVTAFFRQNKNKLVPVIMLLLVVLGGGTSFAAERALPGDILYPIKIHVNENLQSLLAFNPSANARVQTEQASTRLGEIEKLAAQGTISSETKTEIEKNFSAHVDKVNTITKVMETTGDARGAANINSDLEDKLKIHSSIILNISKKDEKNQQSLDEINATINIYLQDAEKENPGNEKDATPPIHNDASKVKTSLETTTDTHNDTNNTNINVENKAEGNDNKNYENKSEPIDNQNSPTDKTENSSSGETDNQLKLNTNIDINTKVETDKNVPPINLGL